ncbi:MAG: hypothetical protein JO328_21235 [Hyphomicrobiales bacterium]|nr:hypothetical protein [Hyphomicrobiales bacterium]
MFRRFFFFLRARKGAAVALWLILAWIIQQTFGSFVADFVADKLRSLTGYSESDLMKLVSDYGFSILLAALVIFLAYKVGQIKPSASADTKNKDATRVRQTIERDVWLFDAICRMYLGKWERISSMGNRRELDVDTRNALYELVARDIRQFAFEGRLPIWGKFAPLALWHRTDSEFWEYHGVDWSSFLLNDPKKLRVTKYMLKHQSTVMSQLMTSRVKVDELCESEYYRAMHFGNDANALRIVVGHGDKFDHIVANQYGVHHTKRLGIKNTGSKRITNCIFYRKYLSFGNDQERVCLTESFSLDSEEVRYVDVALFNETKDLPHANHLIALTLPPGSGGYWDAHLMAPRLPPDRRHVLSFEVTSTDTQSAEAHCEVWIDEAGKLCLDHL